MKKTTAVLIAAVLAVGGFSVLQSQSADCATLYVDYGPIGDSSKTTECIPVSGKTNALDFLANAGFMIEGTREYGNAVVCRVNGLPDPVSESCDGMPPAEAYWAIIVKEKQLVPIPLGIGSAWGWAQTGINEIYVDSGDSIGLVFADNGEVRFP
jgi:hypothetical protein